MDSFDEGLEILKTQRQAPVVNEQRKLAPVRAELEQIWDAFLKRQPILARSIQAAQAKQQQAAAVGVHHAPLDRALVEINGHDGGTGALSGVRANYEIATAKIDGLSGQDLNFVNVIPSLYNAPAGLRASIGHLEELVATVQTFTRTGGELDEIVVCHAQAARPATVAVEPPPA